MLSFTYGNQEGKVQKKGPGDVSTGPFLILNFEFRILN
jgi:hypothetical protein